MTTPQVLDILAARKISELPVVDADHRPLGLIDITDVLPLLPREPKDRETAETDLADTPLLPLKPALPRDDSISRVA